MKPKKQPTFQTLDTVKLDAVTGGCAACGNPNHQLQQQRWPQEQRA
jgi:hypothetical protein